MLQLKHHLATRAGVGGDDRAAFDVAARELATSRQSFTAPHHLGEKIVSPRRHDGLGGDTRGFVAARLRQRARHRTAHETAEPP